MINVTGSRDNIGHSKEESANHGPQTKTSLLLVFVD